MPSPEDFLLGDWLVQPKLNRVSRGGVSASLQPRFMDLLVYLAGHPGEVVSKEEILEAVWRREFVSEGTLTHAVAVIRQALGDDVRRPMYIETIPVRGYRLVARVASLPESAPPQPTTPPSAASPDPVERRGTHRVLLGAAAVAVLAAGAWAAIHWLQGSPLWPGAKRPLRIVVMPFQNLGPSARDYVALGITDDITTRLASVHGIAVSSRTSAAYCAKAERSAEQIASELDVDVILEGTVGWGQAEENGGALRVTAQLVRAANDTLIWAQTYRGDDASGVGIGALVARQAIKELNVPVYGTEHARLDAMPTESPDAYQAFLCGMRYQDLEGRDQMGLAVAMFQRAVKLDPSFALAYAELAVAHTRIYHQDVDPTPARLLQAEHAARRALELRPTLPEAHLALGVIQHLAYGHLAAALSEYTIAARDLPNDSDLSELIADVHRRQGRWNAALGDFQKAVDLDPTSGSALLALGDTLSYVRAYAEADRAFRQATNTSPDQLDPYLRRFWNYLWWDGSATRAERVLSDVPLPDASEVAVCRSYVKFLARDVQGAVDDLSQAAPDAQLAPFRVPSRAFLECRYLDLAGDRAGSARACAAALGELGAPAAASREGPWRRLALARVLAALGRSAEAARAAEEAAAACPISADAYDGASCALQRALILERIGDRDGAIAVLARLLAVPSPVSVPWLRLDPAWDRLRSDPRFAALLAAKPPP